MNIDLAASVAIIENNRILLTQRSDVKAWCLPGGRVEAGESVAGTAIREALEETGLHIRLVRLVGIYYVPHWKYGDNHEVLFVGERISGILRPQPSEVSAAAFFELESLPDPLLWWHRQRILDALNGIGGGVVWTQGVDWPFGTMSRKEREELRLQSGLPQEEFYRQYFSRPSSDTNDVEVLLVPDQILSTKSSGEGTS